VVPPTVSKWFYTCAAFILYSLQVTCLHIAWLSFHTSW